MIRKVLAHCAVFGALLLSSPTLAADALPSEAEGRRQSFGAVTAPPTLPAGSSSAYVFVGAPEVGVGYRQGISPLELELRARFDYLVLAFGADVVFKHTLLAADGVELAPTLGLGLTWDTGSQYFDERNSGFLAVRLTPGMVVSYRAHDTLRVLGVVEVPWDIGVKPTESFRTRALFGGGVEFYLDDELALLGTAQLGPDFLRERLGVAQGQLGYSIKLGIGYRLF